MNFVKPKDLLSISGRISFIYRRADAVAPHLQKPGLGDIVRVSEYTNLITTVGKVAVARRLAGDLSVANPGEITFGSVGTGTDLPAVTDTTLQTEFFRKLLSVRTFTTNTAILQMFMNSSEGNANLREFALFGEAASAAADSGTMFNRVNITEDKTAATTLTIEAQIQVG